MKGKLIWFVLTVAFLLRFMSFGILPTGLNADEASFGYDAYSILHTGKDQWGQGFPIVLKSFGDYKSPVYAYLTVPSVAIFGLNAFATRLPNAIIGTLAVLAVYLLVLEICKLKIINLLKIKNYKLEIIASILLATNPWSVMMSRGALEANLITFFLPMGIYFFLKGLSNYKYFMWSALFMGLNMFTYHSAKVITPLMFVGLSIIFRNELRKINFTKLITPLIIFLVFLVGMLYTFKIGGGSRISERSITQGAILQGFDERMKVIANGSNPVLAKVFHNKYQVIVNRFIKNYSQYFSPRFLVQKGVGDASYTMIPGIGVISILEIIFLLGVIPLFFYSKDLRKLLLILFLWLVITPLPAALASGGGYSGNRASGMLPILQIIEVFGFYGWTFVFKKIDTKWQKIIVIGIFVVFTFSTFTFVKSYFKTQSTTVLKQQGYGNLEVMRWLYINSNGKNVVVSRSISEPQIFVAFANRWDPTDFQNSTKTWGFDPTKTTWVDQIPEYSLGNYKFKSIDWETDVFSNSLIVARADEFKGNYIPIMTFNYPDGTPNIYVIDTNQKIYANNFK